MFLLASRSPGIERGGSFLLMSLKQRSISSISVDNCIDRNRHELDKSGSAAREVDRYANNQARVCSHVQTKLTIVWRNNS